MEFKIGAHNKHLFPKLFSRSISLELEGGKVKKFPVLVKVVLVLLEGVRSKKESWQSSRHRKVSIGKKVFKGMCTYNVNIEYLK